MGAEVVLLLECVHALLEVNLQPLVALRQQLVHRGRQPLVVLLVHLEEDSISQRCCGSELKTRRSGLQDFAK